MIPLLHCVLVAIFYVTKDFMNPFAAYCAAVSPSVFQLAENPPKIGPYFGDIGLHLIHRSLPYSQVNTLKGISIG